MEVVYAKCVLKHFNMFYSSEHFTVCVFPTRHYVFLKHTVTFTYSTVEEEIE